MRAARVPRRQAGLLLVALLLAGAPSATQASSVGAARRWIHAAAAPQVPPSQSAPPVTPPATPPATPPVTPPATPHPAVVRVVVPERDGTSYGSGTLIDIRDNYGLVLTNWHVVRDALGTIEVLFPDGFRSAARALKVDRNWDLAALVIWRPPAAPVSLALAPPRPGDPLTIAGYGRGPYRMAVGRCTQYVAPGRDQPYEMVEVGVAARQGDSGGPIFNERGKLAGVLFGSGGGTTTGSYCGRVGGFLADLGPSVGRGLPAVLVRSESVSPPDAVAAAPVTVAAAVGEQPPAEIAADSPIGVPASQLAENPPSRTRHVPPEAPPAPVGIASVAALPAGPRPPEQAAVTAPAAPGQSPIEQAKTVLAVIGGVSLLLLAARAARV